jgi:hypothetical protein
VQLEPDTVVAVDTRRRDESLVAVVCQSQRSVEASSVRVESRQDRSDRRVPVGRVGIERGQVSQDARVVLRVAVVIELLPAADLAHLPGGHDLLHPPVKRVERLQELIAVGVADPLSLR